MIISQKRFRREQWKMLLVTMFCYLFFYTGRHNFGWAAAGMSADLGISYTMVGWISFSMLIGYAAGQLINGNLADRFDPRIMVSTGALLSVAVNFAISFATAGWAVMLLWALNGYFQSMAWAPGGRLISNWWGREERGTAFGFYTMAAGSSSAVTYLMSVLLLQNDLDWRWLFRIPVSFLLLATVIFYLLARARPSQKGFPELPGNDVTPETKGSWKARYRVVLSNRSFLVASLAIGFESMARYGLIFWVPVHYLGSDWKARPSSLWITLCMPLGMALGALMFGRISDTVFKGNRPRSIRLGMLVSACIAMLIYMTPDSGVITASVLMLLAGFFVYGPQANFWPMSPDLLGEKYVGTGIGIMNMSAYLFAAMGEPILGRIIDQTGDTASVFPVIALACILSAIAVSFVRRKKVAFVAAAPAVSPAQP